MKFLKAKINTSKIADSTINIQFSYNELGDIFRIISESEKSQRLTYELLSVMEQAQSEIQNPYPVSSATITNPYQ